MKTIIRTTAVAIAMLLAMSGLAVAQGVVITSPTGDITAVTAGTGLTGGATAGAATVNVGCGTGLTCAADSITYDSSVIQSRVSSSCTPPNSIAAIAANGTVTCTTGVSTLTNSAPNTVLPKSDGTNLVASRISDDGTDIELLTAKFYLDNGVTTNRLQFGASAGVNSIQSGATGAAGSAATFSIGNMQLSNVYCTWDTSGNMTCDETSNLVGDVNLGSFVGATTPKVIDVDGQATFNMYTGPTLGVGTYNVRLMDYTEPQAAGIGPSLYFGSNYTNTGSFSGAAEIKAMKTNGTDGNNSFGLAFATKFNAQSGFTQHMYITDTGSIAMGDVPGVSSTYNNFVSDNVDVLVIGQTGTGQTTSGVAELKITNTGSYSTAGGAVTHYAANISTAATESAGASTFTNVALRLSSTTGDVQRGLWVDDGATQLDGTLTVDGNTTLGDSTSADSHVISGTTTATYSGTASIAFTALHTATGATGSRVGLYGAMTGSMDTSAAARVSYGILGENTATTSAGASLHTKYGGHFTASSIGGNSQSIGVYASGVTNSFYGALGTLYNAGNATIEGDTALGNAVGDILDVNGDLSKFGNTSGDGALYIYNNTLNAGYAQGGNFELAVNYLSNTAGTGNFRDFTIYDGKSAQACKVTGSTKAFNCVGNVTLGDSTSADSHTINGTTTASYTSTGNVFNVSYSGTAQSASRYAVNATNTGTYTTGVGAAGMFTSSAARSSGTSGVTSAAVYASATGGACPSGGGGCAGDDTAFSVYGAAGVMFNAEKIRSSTSFVVGNSTANVTLGKDWGSVSGDYYLATTVGTDDIVFGIAGGEYVRVDGDDTQVEVAVSTVLGDSTSDTVHALGYMGLATTPSATQRLAIGQTTLATGIQLTDSSTGQTHTTSKNISITASGTNTETIASTDHFMLYGADTFVYSNTVGAFGQAVHSVYGGLLSVAPTVTGTCSATPETSETCPAFNVYGMAVGVTVPTPSEDGNAIGYGFDAAVIGASENSTIIGANVAMSSSDGASYGFKASLTGTGFNTYGVHVSSTAGATNNYGAYFDVGGSGTQNVGVYANANNASTNNIALYVDAGTTATNNYGIYSYSGDNVFNAGGTGQSDFLRPTNFWSNTAIGNDDTDVHGLRGTMTMIYASSSASFVENNSVLIIRDEADAAGVGGGIEFQGNYNGGGTPTAAALIKAMKSNATAGNYSFDLVLGTRPHGGNLTEVLRLYDGVATPDGAKVTGNFEATNGFKGVNGYESKYFEWTDDYTFNVSTAMSIAAGWAGIPIAEVYSLGGLSGGSIGPGAYASGRFGVMQMSTGTTTTGSINILTNRTLANFDDGDWSHEITVMFNNLSVAGERYAFQHGFIDEDSDPNQTDGCYFTYDEGDVLTNPTTGDTGGISGDYWSIWCASNGTRTGYKLDGTASENSFTTISSTVAASTWYRLRVLMDNSSLARFFINEVEVGNITTNIPTGSGRVTGAGYQIMKSTGTNAQTSNIDHSTLSYTKYNARS